MPICPKCRGENPELGAKCPRDGFYYIHDDAVEDAAEDEWIGRLAADKYVILSLISEGGMGAVYRALQLPVQREVAFKVLRAELQDSGQGQDRFAREARAVSKLSHPNIITMHDFGVDAKGHPFMAMEYAPGISLADWIVQPGIKLPRIIHVFRQILSALSEAHNQGIVHRDLKPENLIVTHTGADKDFVKLLDFGIARMVHDGATRGLTREGEVFGTPHYMAPEQAQGKKEIGPPADVYALGIMLFEMLVGDCPFDAPTPLSILYMHINDDLPELAPRMGITVPPTVREVLEKATAKKVSDRYQNAGEMLVAFDQATDNPQGKYVAPASTSSDGNHATQRVGARDQSNVQHEKKATADTLNYDGASVQHITGSSNSVPINDPEQRHSTTDSLAALQPSTPNKALMVVVVVAIIAGLGSAFVFLGDDPNEVEAIEHTATEVAEQVDERAQAQASDEQVPADREGASKQANAADSQEELPADQAPRDEAEGALDHQDTSASSKSLSANSGSEAAAKQAPNTPEKAASTARARKTATASSTGSATSSKTSPTEAADSPSKVATPDGSNTNTQGDDDAPKKFQPKKFEPKTSSDNEPKKFEPRKWR